MVFNNLLEETRSIAIPELGENVFANTVIGSSSFHIGNRNFLEAYKIARAQADIAAKFAENMTYSDDRIVTFDYGMLIPILQELQSSRESLVENGTIVVQRILDPIKDKDLIDFYGDAPLREEVTISTEEGKLNPELMNLFRANYMPTEEQGDLAYEYYSTLNFLDTFQTTSVESNWEATMLRNIGNIQDAEQNNRAFPINSGMQILNHDPKNKNYLSQARFHQKLMDSEDEYFLVCFDAVGLNTLNRISLEEASKELLTLLDSPTPNYNAADDILKLLLRDVDQFMFDYNNAIRQEFIDELEIDESEFIGKRGGDETWVAIKASDLEGRDIYDLTSTIKQRVEEQFSYKGKVPLKLRAGISNYQPVPEQTIGDEIQKFLLYGQALSQADKGAKKAKTNELKGLHNVVYNKDVVRVNPYSSDALKSYFRITAFDELVENHVRGLDSGEADEPITLYTAFNNIFSRMGFVDAIPPPIGERYNVHRLILSGNSNYTDTILGKDFVSLKYINGAQNGGEEVGNHVISNIFDTVRDFCNAYNWSIPEKRSGKVTIVE